MEAHDMELNISINENMGPTIQDPIKGKDKQDARMRGVGSVNLFSRQVTRNYDYK